MVNNTHNVRAAHVEPATCLSERDTNHAFQVRLLHRQVLRNLTTLPSSGKVGLRGLRKACIGVTTGAPTLSMSLFRSYQSPKSYRAPKTYGSPHKYQAPAQYGVGLSLLVMQTETHPITCICCCFARQTSWQYGSVLLSVPDSNSQECNFTIATGGQTKSAGFGSSAAQASKSGGTGTAGGSSATGGGGGGAGGGGSGGTGPGGGSGGDEAADGGGRGRMQPLTIAFALFVLGRRMTQ